MYKVKFSIRADFSRTNLTPAKMLEPFWKDRFGSLLCGSERNLKSVIKNMVVTGGEIVDDRYVYTAVVDSDEKSENGLKVGYSLCTWFENNKFKNFTSYQIIETKFVDSEFGYEDSLFPEDRMGVEFIMDVWER